MKEKINQNLHWLNAFLLLLCIPLLSTLLSTIGIDRNGYIFSILLAPFVYIHSTATLIAIQVFGGNEVVFNNYASPIIYLILNASILLMLFTYILSKGVKQAESQSEEKKNKPFLWYAGVVLVSVSMIMSSVKIFEGYTIFSNTKKSSYASSLSDQARNQLADLAFEASSKMMAPTEVGGGAGSFEGFIATDGSKKLLSLEDLESYNSIPGFTYEIKKGASEKTIEIYAYINYEHPELVNKVKPREAKSSSQLKMIVSPFEKNILTLR